jgi:hypothetical protein
MDIFIPPQLAEQVVKHPERTHLEDMFGHQRLKENEDHLPAPKSRIEEILKGGNSRIKGLGKSTWRAPVPRYNRQNPVANIENLGGYSSKNRACQSNFPGITIPVFLCKPIYRQRGATAKGHY